MILRAADHGADRREVGVADFSAVGAGAAEGGTAARVRRRIIQEASFKLTAVADAFFSVEVVGHAR